MIVAVLSGTLVGAVGCGATGDDVPIHVKEQLVSLVSASPGIALAEKVSISDCMRQAGFELEDNASFGVPSVPALVALNGLISSEEQAATGYGSTAKIEGDGGSEAMSPERQEAFDLAMNGSDESARASYTIPGVGAVMEFSREGCVAQGRVEVYGSLEDALQVKGYINAILHEAQKVGSGAEKAIASTQDAYQECMAGNGYDLKFPDADKYALAEFGQYRLFHEEPSAEEQQLAMTDYSCQQESGMVDAVNEAFFDSAAAWITSNEEEILGMAELRQEAELRSKQIINAGG